MKCKALQVTAPGQWGWVHTDVRDINGIPIECHCPNKRLNLIQAFDRIGLSKRKQSSLGGVLGKKRY